MKSNTYKSTQSAWENVPAPARYSTLKGSISVDVAIIGGGITGITAAALLTQAGKKVAVLEARRVAGDTTGGTTAHITQWLDMHYGSVLSNFGEDGARLAAESTRAALERIAAMVSERGIDCDFERVPGYLYTENADDISLIDDEAQAAQKVGMNVTVLDAAPLPFPTKRAMMLPDQAQFHPLKYVYALARSVHGKNGSAIYENTRVTGVKDGKPCQLKTESGSVTAINVIMATHTPINFHLLQTELTAYRSYVLLARLNSPIIPGLYWDTEDPYNYIRAFSKDQSDLVIIGGRDHKTGQVADTESRHRELEEYARAHFDVASIGQRWSAQWYEPADGLPYIGKDPLSGHVYIATGYSGTGMTFGTLAAMMLSDEILGHENPYRDLYSIGRVKPIAAGPTVIAEGINTAKRFVLDRFSHDADMISEVQPGEGKIVEREGEQVAVYRDDKGGVHMLSPVCAHMGCIVHWNPAESSWDCPCHGARYEPTGDVIEGPPTSGLKTASVEAPA